MARKSIKLTVRFSLQAERTLLQIWRWNATEYSEPHADRYLQYLVTCATSLETAYGLGKVVPTNPAFRYQNLRRKSASNGHVIVYKINPSEIYVVDFFHTAQDWHTYAQDYFEG